MISDAARRAERRRYDLSRTIVAGSAMNQAPAGTRSTLG